MKTFYPLMLALAMVALPGLASADDGMAPYRAALHGDQRQFYADHLMITEKDGKKFWPLFNEYQADQKELDDKLFMLLQNYANLYKQGSISDRKAKPLMKEAMEIEEEYWKLQDKMMNKAKKILPASKATLFMQIDNRMRIAARYERALQVPLIN